MVSRIEARSLEHDRSGLENLSQPAVAQLTFGERSVVERLSLLHFGAAGLATIHVDRQGKSPFPLGVAAPMPTASRSFDLHSD